MRILLVGAGATGGFYGGKLVAAGRDVTFLVREGRARHIREHGLQIVAHTGEVLKLQPRVISADELARTGEQFDLVVLTTKAYQLEGAMEDMAPAVGPETMILPILNGIRHLDVLDERFGAERVLGGSVRIVSDLDAAGRIVQMGPLDQMNYGERTCERTDRILAVDQAMQGAGFLAALQPDIMATLWGKWVFLASMGAVCILARGNIGEINRAPHGTAFALMVAGECGAIAEANGYPQSAEMVKWNTERLTDPGSKLTSSMYRDMMKGSAVEADHIVGDLLDRAKGVAAPLMTAAYVQLKIYEAGREA